MRGGSASMEFGSVSQQLLDLSGSGDRHRSEGIEIKAGLPLQGDRAVNCEGLVALTNGYRNGDCIDIRKPRSSSSAVALRTQQLFIRCQKFQTFAVLERVIDFQLIENFCARCSGVSQQQCSPYRTSEQRADAADIREVGIGQVGSHRVDVDRVRAIARCQVDSAPSRFRELLQCWPGQTAMFKASQKWMRERKNTDPELVSPILCLAQVAHKTEGVRQPGNRCFGKLGPVRELFVREDWRLRTERAQHLHSTGKIVRELPVNSRGHSHSGLRNPVLKTHFAQYSH